MSTYFQSVLKMHALDITQGVLAPLTSKQLTTFCGLLGIPTSGTVATKRERILTTLQIRWWLKPYYDMCSHNDPGSWHRAAGAMRRNFSDATLLRWVRALKLYQSTSKGGRALGLLGWVDACKLRSREYHKQHVSERYVVSYEQQPSLLAYHPQQGE